jgi:hypothetical protein
MNALHGIAATAACGVLWLLGELFCELAWGVLRFILTIPFLPVHWAIVSALAGPRRMGWLRVFIGASLALAVGGMWVIATADDAAPLPGSGALLLVAAVLALIEVEQAWKEAREFLAKRAIAS